MCEDFDCLISRERASVGELGRERIGYRPDCGVTENAVDSVIAGIEKTRALVIVKCAVLRSLVHYCTAQFRCFVVAQRLLSEYIAAAHKISQGH